MVTYMRVAREPDGRQSYAQRSAARRAADAERQKQNNEPSPDPIYNLPVHERQRLRYAEAEGRREGAERAAIQEQAKRQAEIDALLPHERRPMNEYRLLIEKRRPDAWRPEVRRRLREWERMAREEDERIDAEMAEKKRRFELESSPEYERATDHLQRIGRDADPTELEALARLRGVLDAGDTAGYWRGCQPLTEARLQRVQQDIADHAARQAPLDQEGKVLAQREKAAAEQLRAAEAEQATEEAAPAEPKESVKNEQAAPVL